MLVLDDRIDMIVEREFQKDSEEFVKSEMVLPRKTESAVVMGEEEAVMESTTENAETVLDEKIPNKEEI